LQPFSKIITVWKRITLFIYTPLFKGSTNMNTPFAHGIPRLTFTMYFSSNTTRTTFQLYTISIPSFLALLGIQIQFFERFWCRNAESVSGLRINSMHVQSCFPFKNECSSNFIRFPIIFLLKLLKYSNKGANLII